MLASSFEFFCKNDSGAQIAIGDVDINYVPWKFDADGAVEYGTPQALTNAGAIADAASGSCGSVDNSTDKNLGAHLDVTFAATVGATGTVQLFMRLLNADQDTIALVAVTDITAQKILGVEI